MLEFQSEWLSVFSERVKNKKWYWAKKKWSNAVMVIPYLDHETIFMIKQYRPSLNAHEWTFVSGLIECDEVNESDVRAAAKRELKEESNCELLQIKSVSRPLTSTSGITNEQVYLVWADVNVDELKNSDVDEEIHIQKIKIAHIGQFQKSIRKDYIAAKAWLALELIKTQHKI